MKTRGITKAGIIAAVYVCLTYLGAPFASGVIQVRLSEALCVLPIFSPYAIPGIFAGCIVANLVTGAVIWDVVFGSIATLIGAFGTYFLRNTRLYFLPPVISNAIIVPLVLRYAYNLEGAMWWFVLTVGAGELVSCGVLGSVLAGVIKKNPFLLKHIKN